MKVIKFRGVHDVADELGVDVQTVRRWIHSGKLRAFKPGKEYRIQEADLEEFLRAREVRPKALSSSLEPSLNDALEDERRDAIYRPWLDFVNRYADRWEARMAAGDFDMGNVNEFIATVEDVMAVLRELNTDEARGLPDQPYSFGAPGAKTGVAILRLADLIDPLINAGTAKFDSSELEQLRRKRDEARRALERSA